MSNDALTRRFITGNQAKRTKTQHTQPCADCPFSKTAINGWLGGTPLDEWVWVIGSEATVKCHCAINRHCAGAAIFRANTAKQLRDPNAFKLPPDNGKRVFATRQEFLEHHLKHFRP